MSAKKKHWNQHDWLHERLVIGAKESIFFPDLELQVAAKVDTGARTSSLHAEKITPFVKQNRTWVRFLTQGSSDNEGQMHRVELPVYDRREVRSSNGQLSERYVVRLWMELGSIKQKIEVTLADRSQMKYPMLLGRKALEEHFLVAPGASYLLSHC